MESVVIRLSGDRTTVILTAVSSDGREHETTIGRLIGELAETVREHFDAQTRIRPGPYTTDDIDRWLVRFRQSGHIANAPFEWGAHIPPGPGTPPR